MTEFRSRKDKQGKVYTYPVDSDKKTKSKPKKKPRKRLVIVDKPKKITLKKPPSKAVREGKRRIDDIKEILPLSQFVPSNPNNPNAYITNDTSYKQSDDAIAMISKALAKSRKFIK